MLMSEQEVIRLKDENEKEVEILKENLDNVLKESIERIDQNYFQKYDGEKQELYEQIKMLKIELARAKGKSDPDLNFADKFSMFGEGASGLSFIDDPEDEKDFLINKLHNELSTVTHEYRETINEWENYKFLSLKAEKDREYLVHKQRSSKTELENMRRRFEEYKQGSKNFEKEKMIFEKAYNVWSSFVTSLEEEVDTLRGQFRLLEGMIPQDKLLSFQKQSPFTFMKKRNDMAKHTVNNRTVNMINKMFRDTYKSEGTLTEIWGTDKEILMDNEKVEDLKIPVFDFGHQTALYKLTESQVQTDMTVGRIKELEENVDDLKQINEQLDKGNLKYEEMLNNMKNETSQNDKLDPKTISPRGEYNNSESDISDTESKDKVFITEQQRPKRSRKSTKSRKTYKGTSSSKSGSCSRTKSKYGSIEVPSSRTKSRAKSRGKMTYVYCKDCKRRRVKRKTETANMDLLNTKKLKNVDTLKKINSTKILRSKNSMIQQNLMSKTDEDESDFKLDESIYSRASFDSVHSWTYGKFFL